jgi:hypothetical protein
MVEDFFGKTKNSSPIVCFVIQQERKRPGTEDFDMIPKKQDARRKRGHSVLSSTR